MKKLLREETTFNQSTGEIVTTSKTISIPTSSEAFYMSYIENMSKIFDIKSLIDMKVLTKLSMLAGFNTGIVSLSPADRDDILNSVGINNQQMSKSLKSLVSLELISGSKGRYIINPAVFWKGSTAERTKLIMNGGLSFNIKIEGMKTKKTVMEPSKAFGE